jgi:hypothetical protein
MLPCAERAHQGDPLLRLHLCQHGANIDRIEAEIPGPLQFGVDRNEIVLAADLQPVTGIEEQGEVSAFELAAEFADDVVHAMTIEV